MSLLEKRTAVYYDLLAAARGDIQPDLLIRGGKVLNLLTGEMLPGDVAIHKGFIVSLFRDLPARDVLDARGLIVAPAYIDPHVHIESSMVLPPAYAAVVAAHGTGTVFADPHEIANVMGVAGFEMMVSNTQGLPLRMFFDASTCVPSRRGVESSGAEIDAEDVRSMAQKGARKLGELMSVEEIISGDPVMSEIVRTGWALGLPRDAHFPLMDAVGRAMERLTASEQELVASAMKTGKHFDNPEQSLPAFKLLLPHLRALDHAGLNAYLVALGLTADHETYGPEAQIKLDHGMRLMLSSHIFNATPALSLLLTAVKNLRYKDSIGLCTDDIWPDDLLENGGMAGVLRDLVSHGIDPVDAIRFATHNNAQRLAMAGIPEAALLGGVSPGMAADLVLLQEPLADFQAAYVLHEGSLVAENGRVLQEAGPPHVPAEALESVQLSAIQAAVFKVPVEGRENGQVRVRILKFSGPQALTSGSLEEEERQVNDGMVDTGNLMTVAVFNRYGRFTGKPPLALVRGYGLHSGAIASTLSHDSHNLVVLGMNAADMAQAASRVIAMSGGMAAVQDGHLLAEIPFPVAGLMTMGSVEEAASMTAAFREAIAVLGLDPHSPIMPFLVFTLPAGPGAKVTDLGLWDDQQQAFVPLLV